jgi:hypothetical protein
MEAFDRCGLSVCTLVLTDNRCEEVLRLQLLIDKMEPPHCTHVIPPDEEANFFPAMRLFVNLGRMRNVQNKVTSFKWPHVTSALGTFRAATHTVTTAGIQICLE